MRKIYASNEKEIAATAYKEAQRTARKQYQIIQKKTPRRMPYVRSKYFKGSKIFLHLFWNHINQKNNRDKLRRLKLFPAAIDLIQNSSLEPDKVNNPNIAHETLYRFYGLTRNQTLFCVQIKEDERTRHRYLLSVFPI